MNEGSEGRFITFACECGQKLRVPAERAGAKGRCRACGRTLVVPMPEHDAAPPADEFSEPPSFHTSPIHVRHLEGTYSEEDLITYPRERPIRKEPVVPPEALAAQKSLYENLGDILRYPFADKLAMQIFFSGAFFFSPMMWAVTMLFKLLGCIGLILIILWSLIVMSVRLMYFSYLLLIIEHSAQGSKEIPDLPVFQSWEENLKDLLKVLAVSAIAFSPFLLYAFSSNLSVIYGMFESYSRGNPAGTDVFAAASSNLAGLMLLYAVASFYMPMVLMALVVTKSFRKAVNPVFIIRSIARIGHEYLIAMFIIFIGLRGTLTVMTIIKDVLMMGAAAGVITYVVEPFFKFYAFVITMHVIGLLYYRNGDKLQWQ